MAVGRILRHRSVTPGDFPPTTLKKGLQWRHVALIALAIVAAAIAGLSLIIDPPNPAPPATSYLPAPNGSR